FGCGEERGFYNRDGEVFDRLPRRDNLFRLQGPGHGQELVPGHGDRARGARLVRPDSVRAGPGRDDTVVHGEPEMKVSLASPIYSDDNEVSEILRSLDSGELSMGVKVARF